MKKLVVLSCLLSSLLVSQINAAKALGKIDVGVCPAYSKTATNSFVRALIMNGNIKEEYKEGWCQYKDGTSILMPETAHQKIKPMRHPYSEQQQLWVGDTCQPLPLGKEMANLHCVYQII